MRVPGTPRRACAALPLLILLGATTLLTSCAEDENPVGFDRSGRSIDSQVREVTLNADSSYAVLASPATGTSRSILVGSDAQTRMVGLIRFDSIPDTTDLSRAYLRIHLRMGRGSALSLSLRQIEEEDADWTASDVEWPGPAAKPEPLSTLTRIPTSTIEADSTDSAAFAVPLDLLRAWKADPDGNGGFQIASDSGTGTARIISHNDVLYGVTYRIATPSLHLVYQDSERDETIVLASADAYVVEDLRPEPERSESTAWVTAGPATRLRLHFGLEPLLTSFPDASIVRATLILPVAQTEIIASDPMLLGAYAVTDTSGSLAASAIGLSNDITDPFDLEIGSLVQSWVNGGSNFGLVVRANDEVSTMEGILFHTASAAADTLRPRLRIVFVGPPGARWPVAP